MISSGRCADSETRWDQGDVQADLTEPMCPVQYGTKMFESRRMYEIGVDGPVQRGNRENGIVRQVTQQDSKATTERREREGAWECEYRSELDQEEDRSRSWGLYKQGTADERKEWQGINLEQYQRQQRSRLERTI